MRHGRAPKKIAGMLCLMVIGLGSAILFRPDLPLLNLVSHPASVDDVDASLLTQTVPMNFQPGHATAAKVEVYVILSTECPISNAYLPELNRLTSGYGASGVRWFGVLPAAHLTDADIERFRAQYQLTFPLLIDRQQQLVSQLQATHTPQVIVMDGLRQVYSGRIDNRYADLGKARRAASEHDLVDVLELLLSGKELVFRKTPPIGCVIQPVSYTSAVLQNKAASADDSVTEATRNVAVDLQDLTYCRDVAPIIYRHCSRCHRPGEAAPFSLLDYEDVRDHSAQIDVVVRRRLMPPWKAEPDFGHFANAQRLTDQELDILCHWIASPMHAGDDQDLPLQPLFASGWQLGRPDVELIMPEAFSVPADGPDIYQHFVIPTGVRQNRLVNAVEFRPGAPEVVHHSFMYFDVTGRGRELDAEDPGLGYSRLGSPGFAVSGSLGGWGPGGLPRRLPRGMGRALGENADLILQIHYHPIGRPVQDQSRVGLYFAPEGATHEVTEILVASVDLAIPAGAKRHHHRAEYVLPTDTTVFDATPHMHTLGREIKAVAHLPDGTTEPLLWIKDWDFYWQENYVYQQPLRLPRGTRLELDCWFDNSADNPLNPHSPPQTVYWGDFSTDEMAICYFQATTDTWEDYVTLHKHAMAYFNSLWKTYELDRAEREE